MAEKIKPIFTQAETKRIYEMMKIDKNYIYNLESALTDAAREAEFIVNRENLTFAECRDAEDIVNAAKKILEIIKKTKGGK